MWRRRRLGIIANALTPAAFALAESTTWLKPVHIMTGMSVLKARISFARSKPVISGIVWSVMTRSNRDGSTFKSARASLLLTLDVTS